MCGFRYGITWTIVLGATISIVSGEAKAQIGSFSLAAPPAPLSSGAQYGPAGFPAYSPQSVATDPVGIGGMAGQSNLFNNPFAAPLLYSGMMGMSPGLSGSAAAQSSSSSTQSAMSAADSMGLSPQQMGFMMMASTPQMLGAGAGQQSGVRPGTSQSQGMGTMTLARARASAQQPGGLAASYFNRTAKINRSPQSYFNRQTRYFPVVGR
jgi:hypothetical protein